MSVKKRTSETFMLVGEMGGYSPVHGNGA